MEKWRCDKVKRKLMMIIVFFPLLVIRPVNTLATQDYWPTESWLSATPENTGMDSTIFAGIQDYMNRYDLNLHSMLVIKNGYIIEETYPDSEYDQDSLHDIWSCTKSISSALIGIAIREGYIDNIDQKVLDFFPDREIAYLDARKQSWTIEHLLTMTTGQDWREWGIPESDPGNTAIQLIQSEDWVQFILDRPVSTDPGKKFNYNTGSSHLLSAIIQQATGNTTLNFAQKFLFDPLGISDFEWGQDPQGVYFGGHGLNLRPRDMAKFGFLYLNNGTWEVEQIIPKEWVETSTKAHVSAFIYILGWQFGHLWWIYPELGLYTAFGYRGQSITVIPNHKLVVIFTADNDDFYPHYMSLIRNFIIPAVTSDISEINEELTLLTVFTIPGILTMIIWRKRRHQN